MNRHVDEWLFDLALGRLSDAERAPAEKHLAECARCQDELAITREALAALPSSLDPIAPSPEVRARLLERARPGRFERFAGEVARLLDVAAERARAMLRAVEDPASWCPGIASGITVYNVTGGAATAGAITGFLRLTPGTVFPDHRHLGDEVSFVLQGLLRDRDGRVYHAGEHGHQATGSSHDFTAEGDEDLIFFVVLREGLEVGGVTVRADDPRM